MKRLAAAFALSVMACAGQPGLRAQDGLGFAASSSDPRGADIAAGPSTPPAEGCRFGSDRACAALGHAYAVGQGREKDERRARAYLAKACDFGAEHACLELLALRTLSR